MIQLNLLKIADKLHFLRNSGVDDHEALLATPRYVETLCFLEYMSHLPGGLTAFCERLFEASPDWTAKLPPGEGREFRDSILYCRGIYRENGHGRVAQLTWYLQFWCQETGYEHILFEFRLRFPGFMEVMAKYMDRHAERELKETADTSARKQVFRYLEFARTSQPRIPVVLVSDTGHGKSVGCDTYFKAWPGRARLVEVPSYDTMREFFQAYADCFHINIVKKTNLIREHVQRVIRETGMLIIHDEAHRLLPMRYGKDTPPPRLEWIREHIIDRKVAAAFFCTPQSQEQTLARYMEKTSFNLEQWMRRLPAAKIIDDLPTYDDLVMVAKKLAPEFSDAAITAICKKADQIVGSKHPANRLNGKSGYSIIEQSIPMARFLAIERSHAGRPTAADICEALEFAGAQVNRSAGTLDQRILDAEPSPTPRTGQAVTPRKNGLEALKRGNLEPVLAV